MIIPVALLAFSSGQEGRYPTELQNLSANIIICPVFEPSSSRRWDLIAMFMPLSIISEPLIYEPIIQHKTS